MAEIWKDVVGYEGMYQVSDRGRARRISKGPGTYPGRLLKPYTDAYGYLRVDLRCNGKRKNATVHRLVAEAFLGPAPSPKHEVNHKNGDRVDNRVENLEWVTRSENLTHAFRVLGSRHGISQGEAHGQAKLTRRDVVEIRRLWATGDYTQAELGEMFGVTQSTIHLIVTRKHWKHVP